jgi:hypothetical protein
VSLHNFLNNLLMQLRKVSNHPLLLRVYYDDSMLHQIAQILVLSDPAYRKDQLENIVGTRQNRVSGGGVVVVCCCLLLLLLL